MKLPTIFLRIIFTSISILFFISFATTLTTDHSIEVIIIAGAILGIVFSLFVFGLGFAFRRMSLKSLNTIALGLFFGIFLGYACTFALTGLLDFTAIALDPNTATLLKGSIFLFTLYFGLTFTMRSSEEISASIPFIKFKPIVQKKKDILLDHSILTDSRLIDLASSGLFDNHLIIPRSVLNEINDMVESTQDVHKSRARRALEVIRKLESIPSLELRYDDTDFPEVQDSNAKMIRLARFLDASILTADMNQIEQSSVEGVRIINIHSLAKGLKPVTHTGEFINIKVQRYGKEARQGVGYLDDETMVVINGGAEYIGIVIKAQVLSVKHTSSGRMIFCNAIPDEMSISQQFEENLAEFENAPKNYFAL